MPEFPLVDTHLHLWDVGHLDYPWLKNAPTINRNHLLADYRAACGSVVVSKMVFVQCECRPDQSRQEVEWVTDLAQQDPRIVGIVPWAPLENGHGAEDDLAHLALNPLVKGIRRIIQFEPDPDFCLRPDFVRGVQLLSRFGLACDLCIHHAQLSHLIRLVDLCPEVRFVLDHIGKPNIRDAELEPWRTELAQLAERGNVWCKLSGLATEAHWQTWTVQQFRPYLDHVIESFGFDRLMFGGDWPVAAQATEYPRWVDALDTALSSCSAPERFRIYVQNGEQFYRI
jgi:L-fuconolactonase